MELIEHFKTIPMFAKLRHEQLDLLAAQFKPRHFFPGESIVAQGDLGDQFYIFDGGVVSLSVFDANGTERNIGVLPTPVKNFMGEQALTTQQPFEFQAYAVTDVQAHILERGDFDALLKLHPHFLHAMPFIEEAERKRTRGFEWVDQGEVVADVFHKHWWALMPTLLKVGGALVITLIVTLALGYFQFDWNIWVGLGGMVLALLYFGLSAYDWRNDSYILTSRRIIHVELEFVSIEITDAVPLDKVIGTKVERNGPAGVLGVGDLVIQTSGRQEGNVVFKNVADPPRIAKLIEAQRGKIRSLRAADQRERERERIQQKLREVILPHVVAQERAAAAANMPPPKKAPPPTAWTRIKKGVHGIFQMEYEKDSVITWRKHWYVLLKQEARYLAGLIGLMAVAILYNLIPGFQVLPSGGFLLGGLVLLAFVLIGMWWEWEDWSNDTYAITATQIIDAERLPLRLREKSITAQLDKVEDVHVEVRGPIASFFKYGDLRIETAGAGSLMVFKGIYDPSSIQAEVFKRMEMLRVRMLEREMDLKDRTMLDSLIGYDRIRKEEERHRRQYEMPDDDDEGDDDDDESEWR